MHNLTNINETTRTAICSDCGQVAIHSHGIQVRQSRTYRRWRCSAYANQARKEQRKRNDERKTYCERCKFVAEHVCQLDVHHKDNNHHNNEPTNLETLCANCHRLITVLSMPDIQEKKKRRQLKRTLTAF